MIGIVERLRFDAIRCEVQFSKGVASNIEEAADEIDRLRSALKEIASGHWVGSDGSTYTSREGRIATAALDHQQDSKGTGETK